MTHGRHIYSNSSDMAKATMCTYPQSDLTLPKRKFVLWYCAKFPYINIPDQETDNQSSETTP